MELINNKNLSEKIGGFTLIELLIVIAILVILAVVVILTLNPQELLAQARDSQRISDMATLKSALGLFLVDSAGKGFMGTSSIVYVSIPDTASSTCGDLGLPTLPTSTGWTYRCSTSASSSLTDGTGWLPVNFNSVSSGSPLPKIPTDPTNASSTGLYYTYVTDGAGNFELTSLFESAKYSYLMSRDGGPSNLQYEAGNNLSLSAFVRGLNGLWSLEGSGNDSSGYGINLLASTTTSTNPTYAAGVVGLGGNFVATPPSSGQYLYNNNTSTLLSLPQGNSPFTLGAWVYPIAPATSTQGEGAIGLGTADTCKSDFLFVQYSQNGSTFYSPPTAGIGAYNESLQNIYSGVVLPLNQWSQISGTYNGNSQWQLYLNGKLVQTRSLSCNGSSPLAIDFSGSGSGLIGMAIGGSPAVQASWTLAGLGDSYMNGLADEAFIYNIALSPTQIAAIYNAQKPR